MKSRYTLRFESGEREGEVVPLHGDGLVIGRRPGTGLQILDGSVSGRHAELVVDDEGVLLKDLGSTNGTRVGKSRVLETRLAHGDVVLIGNVPLRFADAGLEDGAAAPEPAEPKSTVARIGADRLARSRRTSALGLVLLLVAAGGAGAWFFLGRGGGPAGPNRRAVTPVAGNLLAEDFSFEEGPAGWTSDASGTAEFFDGLGRPYSGTGALGTDLAEGEWALARSVRVRAGAGRRLVARAQVEADGDALCRLGLELAPAEGGAAPGTVTAWSAATSGGGFEALEVAVDVPPGYSFASVVCRAEASPEGTGSATLDDVVLLSESAGAGARVSFEDARLHLLGDGRVAVLTEIDKVLVAGLRLLAADGGEPLPIEAESTSNGFRLRAAGAGRLEVRVEPRLYELGFATLGESGHQPLRAEFVEEEGVAGLLCGADRDLLRIGLPAGSGFRGRQAGGGMDLEVTLGDGDAVDLQMDFNAERAEAIRLADQARKAHDGGRLGESLRLWGELLDRYPFEPRLVKEGEQKHGKLLQTGLEEARAVRESLERARFFRLVDLFRQSRARVQDIARRYAGSEVEGVARELIGEIDGELAVLEVDLKQDEKQRLESILAVLEARESPKLAARVREYLEENFGGGR